MWVLKGISPTAYNVVSDMTGTFVEGLLVAALVLVWPYLIWESVKRGHPQSLDGLIAPPESLWAAVVRWRRGGPKQLMVLSVLLLAVATLSHTASDIFLDFVSVEVTTNDTLFLTPYTGLMPTYRLLGDTRAATENSPLTSVLRLLEKSNRIVKGLSRFSVLPPLDFVNTNFFDSETTLAGLIHVVRSDITNPSSNIQMASIPEDLQVECEWPTPEHFVREEVLVSRWDAENNNHVILPEEHQVHESRPILDCDYESIVRYKTLEEPEPLISGNYTDGVTQGEGWTILECTNYINVHKENRSIGIRGDSGKSQNWVPFGLNETALAVSRGRLWMFGRLVRYQLTFIMGLFTDNGHNETSAVLKELPNAVEFQVDYSVLTRPTISDLDQGRIFYYLSSWSRNCPVMNASNGELVAALFPNDDLRFGQHLEASGCLIDMKLQCTDLFAQDRVEVFYRNITDEELPWCIIESLTVTLVHGLWVDVGMLAVYAGIANNNNAFSFIDRHQIALNSLAAAYMMTRNVAVGTVPVDGIRARINVGYLCFLVLPLVCALLLLAFKFWQPSPSPVPKSIWDVLVLGRTEEDRVPLRSSSDVAFPPFQRTLKYGIVAEDQSRGFDRLGLGQDHFVPLERPLTMGEFEVPVETVLKPPNKLDPPESIEV